jgi:hypothetical protein
MQLFGPMVQFSPAAPLKQPHALNAQQSRLPLSSPIFLSAWKIVHEPEEQQVMRHMLKTIETAFLNLPSCFVVNSTGTFVDSIPDLTVFCLYTWQ